MTAQWPIVIVVATADFEVYHEVVEELRSRGSRFTTVEADASLPDGATVVIVGADEERDAPVPVVQATPEHPREAVDEAMVALRGAADRTVVGVDPGTTPGIAVLNDDLVVAAFQVPVEDAADAVRREVDGADDVVVRIGDGARLQGARILEELNGVPVELVDETGTTPHLGSGARGMGDVLAAVNIARREGTPIDRRHIEPTDGEVQVIKNRSRERSATNRTITGALARRVATGELTLDEAIERHDDRPQE